MILKSGLTMNLKLQQNLYFTNWQTTERSISIVSKPSKIPLQAAIIAAFCRFSAKNDLDSLVTSYPANWMMRIPRLSAKSIAFSIISILRDRIVGSDEPKGYLRWPDRHMLRIGILTSFISFISFNISSIDQSRRANFASVSSMLIPRDHTRTPWRIPASHARS